MHHRHIQQSDNDEVRLMNETMNPSEKMCNFLLELQGHP